MMVSSAVIMSAEFGQSPRTSNSLFRKVCTTISNGGVGKRGREQRMAWEAMFAQFEKQYPELANEIHAIQNRDLPTEWEKALPVFLTDAKGLVFCVRSSVTAP